MASNLVMERKQKNTRQFGRFELDAKTGELISRGRVRRLQEKPLRILKLLLERPGELVTRENIREALWDADCYVDFDRAINAAVKRLRAALGESAKAPALIDTLPGRGYRLKRRAGPAKVLRTGWRTGTQWQSIPRWSLAAVVLVAMTLLAGHSDSGAVGSTALFLSPVDSMNPRAREDGGATASPEIATDYAWMLGQANYTEEAVWTLRRVIELHPEYALAHSYLGILLYNDGRIEESVPLLESAVTLSGREPIHLANLGLAYSDSGRRTQAVALMTEMQQRSKNEEVNPTALRNLLWKLVSTSRHTQPAELSSSF